jgi:hypothetical protein
MKDLNPYAPPESEINIQAAPSLTDIWREGEFLGAGRSVVFPLRCVRCNIAATMRFNLRIPTYLTFGESRLVEITYCNSHWRQKRRAGWVMVLGTTVSLGCLAMELFTLAQLFTWMPIGFFALSAAALFIGALIYVTINQSPIQVVRMTATTVWVKGCGEEFLNSFNENSADNESA